jgi:DNA polymerase III subunit epsilon
LHTYFTNGMRTVLIIDVETTGLEPSSAHLIEVGAVLFDVSQRSVLSQVSTLLPVAENPVERINRIKAETARATPVAVLQQAKELVKALATHADAYVAHNAAFDSKWLPSMNDKPWICTMEDVRWPRASKAHPSVVSLALDYGVPVWAAHRALADCTYLAQVMEREPALEMLLRAAQEPRQYYVSMLPYEERQRCKEAGFVWDRQVPKAWSKKLSVSEAEALPFPVRLAVTA